MTIFQCILMGFLIVCAISVSFSKKSVEFYFDLYVLQFDYVYYLGLSGVAGSCHYGGGSGSRGNQRFILCYLKENPCHSD